MKLKRREFRSVSAISAAARKVITDAGFGPDYVRHEDFAYMTAEGPKCFSQPLISIDQPFAKS